MLHEEIGRIEWQGEQVYARLHTMLWLLGS
jgi:hypothetical protein